MAPPIVIYDACVLHSSPLRSFLVYLGVGEVVRARWTEEIHAEWTRSVLERHTDITEAQMRRVRNLMDRAVLDSLVTDYAHLIPALGGMPDPNDRHVLAAAIVAKAEFILTANLKDFPEALLTPHGIVALDPDALVLRLLESNPGGVLTALKEQRAPLKNPPLTADQLLDMLAQAGLPEAATALRPFAGRF